MREGEKGKTLQAFLDQKGKEVYWSGIKYLIIGGVYEAKKNQMKRIPEKIGYIEPKKEWIDEDTAFREKRLQKREASKASTLADRYWKLSLWELHERCKKLSAFEQFEFAKAIGRLVLRGKK